MGSLGVSVFGFLQLVGMGEAIVPLTQHGGVYRGDDLSARLVSR